MTRASARIRGMQGISATALALALLMPASALAQEQVAAPAAPPLESPASPAAAGDIVVTGFRQSLEAALNVKRDTISAVDAIVAEDIAKFPDQNLAESLQRIPGISIQRDAGEGRAITVRGLGAQFTRVRVNGLETVATATDGASSNRDRAFDFNVFASELFNSIVVHKTAEASLDEGSLGAVVDLNTGNPLAAKKPGVTVVGSAVASYNDLSKNWGPRLAGLVSYRNEAGTFGVSLSAAYQTTDNFELGNNSVRWVQTPFNSVNGNACYSVSATNPAPKLYSGGVYNNNAACNQASLGFHPRIPRYGLVRHDRDRLGITGSVQFAPTDRTKISIDALYSKFKETREESWGEVLLRSNERSIDVVNPVYDANNNMVSATLNNAYVRTEHYLRKSSTEFYQVGGTWDQDVTDNFRFTLLGGISKSDANIPVETTIVLDDRDANGYSYDYSNMKAPKLAFGTSVTDPANFQLAEIRDRPSDVVNRFKTVQLRTEWDVTEGFQLKLGGMWRRFNFDTTGYTRDTAVCGNGGKDLVLGTITCSPNGTLGPNAVYGFPVDGNLTQLFTLGNAGQPAGTTTQWLVANLANAADYTKLYSRALTPDVGNIRSVQETTSGGYMQVDVKGTILGLDYAGNAGIRYAHTGQRSTGILGPISRTIARSYDDWLPSFNLALYPVKSVIIRAAIAKVMTRPTLGNLTPGGSVDGFNYKISYGNPDLQPYRATNFDLGAEWYFAPGAIFSVAGFVKKIESFPVSQAYSATYASTGLPKEALLPSSPAYINFDPNQIYTITTNVNGSGATLKGVEIALQLPFKVFASGILGNFGVLGNATFIDSSATYKVQGPVVVPNGKLVDMVRTGTLFGVSKQAYNGTLYYDDGRFSARVMASYRGAYIDANSATGNVFEGYGPTTNLDASMRYKLTDAIEVSLEGNNLLDTYRYRYTDIDANRNYENNHFGRTILIGARFKM
ncbi:TonB-dependent receptor [Sphingomonas lycopersici]|uniref:TonB-dependent receptor n=1 Tax=Sphingomonas lycopersici TaxID=2951807 RepID=A0AA41Z753_9SPHN|nr:TonB-dependent receptor [Sphingomonas lycopersici]MCW6534087.1 TonB-dependent receptor [Sphingomonas lycopersici]